MNLGDYQTRPIDQWPGRLTAKRKRAPFKSDFNNTLRLLKAELAFIKAKGVVMLIAIEPREIRQDGLPRADARPKHPGVIVVCTCKHGPFRMSCDRFTEMTDNVRAIALSLYALRTVDRYGCTQNGEQYRGWTALPAPDPGPSTVEEARDFLCTFTGMTVDLLDQLVMAEVFRAAFLKAHPDTGGDDATFKRVMRARSLIEGESDQ